MLRGDERWPSWAALIEDSTARFSDQPVVLDGDDCLTYAELGDVSLRIAGGLIASGVEVGDVVAVWLPNCAAWVAIWAGIARSGAVILPLSTRLRGWEVADMLRRSKAKVLFVAEGFLGQNYESQLVTAESEISLPDLVRRIRVRAAPGGGADFADFQAGGDHAGSEVHRRTAALHLDDVTDLLYTSGTTGQPKGVRNNARRSLRAYWELAGYMGMGPDERMLLVNPLSHSFGLKAGLLASVMRGSCVLPVAVFDPETVLRTVARHRATIMPGPPTLYFGLLNHPGRRKADLATVRSGLTGAAAIPVELVRRVRVELGINGLLTGYGLTEATAIVSCSRPGDDDEHIATTVGRPLDDMQVRVVDVQTGSPLEAGQPGELHVLGYNVMDGYDDPEHNADAFSADGWLRTGDIGTITSDGYVRITDRLKELFIVGGFNVSPAEVEAVLVRHSQITEAAVVGIADERLGEVGVAFVLPRPGTAPDPAEITAWCHERMANFKVPRQVVVVSELPRTAGGKVQKFVLRDEYL